ncbi:MAG: FeoB small GTPase domain-containing protein, partial [Bacteroidales bacterium]
MQIIVPKNLAELPNNAEGIITKIHGHGAFRKRITEMGFVKGKIVKVIKNAPLQDPIEYTIMGYNVSLRRSEASLIEVCTEIDEHIPYISNFGGTIQKDKLKSSIREKNETIFVALVGNPNCGKTTLFNYASGSHERVGNYGGVTVDAKEATIKKNGYTIQLVDLPGTYSIAEYSPEE